MVRVWFITLIICLSILKLHAAELSLVLDNTQIEMGKYIVARIVYLGDTEADLADVQQWEEDFFVDRREKNTKIKDDGQMETIERLRLYPRSSGLKVLDAIALGGAFVRPVEINIKPLIRDTINGAPKWQELPATLWQGQTYDIGIEVPLLHPSNHVGVEDTVFFGFDTVALQPEPSGGNTLQSVVRRWRLTARRVGEILIDPPFVEQRGRGRWRFHLPRVKMMVRPLPAYIPPTLPIGAVSVSSSITIKSRESTWNLTLEKKSDFSDEVYGVRTQLAKLVEGSISKVTLSTEKTAKGSLQIYTIPVPPWSIGLGMGPRISIQYFDTDEGRLKTHVETLPAAWNIPPWAIYVFIELIFAFLAVTVFFIYKSMKRWWTYRSHIKNTTTAHELRRVLLEPYGLHSLNEWECGKGHHRGSQLVKQLNTLCFSQQSKVSFQQVKKQALSFHLIPICIRSLKKS